MAWGKTENNMTGQAFEGSRQEIITDQQAVSTDLVSVSLDDQLPVLAAGEVDYGALLPMEAELPLVGALIKHEFEKLARSEDRVEIGKADNLRRAAKGILDLASDGHLEKMEDAFEIISLAEDRRLSINKVEQLFVEHSLTPAEVSSVYDIAESMGTNLVMTAKFFSQLGLNLTNEDDIDLACSLVESVKDGRKLDPRFSDLAAEAVMELVANGAPLGNILDGKVY